MYSTEVKDEIVSLLKKVQRDGIDNLIKYLIDNDYFTAPASVNGHSNEVGGLAHHSLTVYKNLVSLCQLKNINIPEDSLVLCALLHDLCKVNFYVKRTINKKIDGVWKTIDCWDYSRTFPAGHGEKSVFRAMKFIQLKEDEILAIRWHMGGFDESAKGYDIGEALKRPLVLLLHLADMMSVYIDKV